MDAETTRRLLKAAVDRGLTVRALGPQKNHIQIIGGPLLVNYWPDAKNRSAYVAGTTQRKNNVTPEEAVEMAFKPPVLRPEQRKDKRGFSGTTNGRRKIVRRLRYRYGDNCHWCKEVMIFDGPDGPLRATIEHVIPLSRGGLDNENNMRLAHKRCNNERGGDMPELEDGDGNKRGERHITTKEAARFPAECGQDHSQSVGTRRWQSDADVRCPDFLD
jgi:5-methylcytosine-specific restriction endonuclease McrA